MSDRRQTAAELVGRIEAHLAGLDARASAACVAAVLDPVDEETGREALRLAAAAQEVRRLLEYVRGVAEQPEVAPRSRKGAKAQRGRR